MSEKTDKEIEKILGKMKCPRNFKCYDMGFANLCKAKDIGIESFLVCLEENPYQCKFAIPFGDGFFCQCPLRVYISKKLGT